MVRGMEIEQDKSIHLARVGKNLFESSLFPFDSQHPPISTRNTEATSIE